MEMTLSYRYLIKNLDILETLGFPKATALDLLGLQEVELYNLSDRLPLNLFQDCLTAAVEHTSDKTLALRLGHKFRVNSFGETGALYGFCKNLKQVMSMNNQYQKLAIDAGHVKYVHGDDGSHNMCFRPHDPNWTDYSLITDVLMATYITTYRWLSWGSGEDIICTHLPYLKPEDVEAYSNFLKTDVEINSSNICLQFTDLAISQEITTHNPELLARAQIKLDKLLGEETSSFDFETAVDSAIRGAIAAGNVSAESVAERMGLSLPVFRQKLNETGVTIRPRLDKIRKSICINKLNEGLSFSHVASLLAYNDQAAMNRAFRRWFGMSPSEWRQQNMK